MTDASFEQMPTEPLEFVGVDMAQKTFVWALHGFLFDTLLLWVSPEQLFLET